MNQQIISTPIGNGENTRRELFALTDEQILEIVPEAQDVEISSAEKPTTGNKPEHTVPASAKAHVLAQTPATQQTAQLRAVAPQEPPEWLAQRMKDPWNGDDAREFWQGIQNERQDAAAYREVFAKPEDARALKELYPGGVTEARAVAERARIFDDIDRSYFGRAGNSPQEISASREQLAQQMMREDPAAFREMVFAGLRAIEASAGQAGSALQSSPTATSASIPSSVTENRNESKSAPATAPARTPSGTFGAEHDVQLSAYVSFERAANEDLERSIGGAISRTIEQALPNMGRGSQDASSHTGQVQPLQTRLSAAIRQDVELALKGDRQLGEQVTQILSSRRFDSETRAQVVRLIDDRARQLVPSAAKRVLSDWTQTTLSAHRWRNQKTENSAARTDIPAANAAANNASSRTTPPKSVDYRKLSDEQILEL